MTPKSKSQGHSTYFDGTHWRFVKGDKRLRASFCKKCRKKEVVVELCTPREHSNLIEAKVDVCIAPLIQMLNDVGVKTTNCCCGHGEEGAIFYEQDGKIIKINIKVK